jgi:hypothetical protein
VQLPGFAPTIHHYGGFTRAAGKFKGKDPQRADAGDIQGPADIAQKEKQPKSSQRRNREQAGLLLVGEE